MQISQKSITDTADTVVNAFKQFTTMSVDDALIESSYQKCYAKLEGIQSILPDAKRYLVDNRIDSLNGSYLYTTRKLNIQRLALDVEREAFPKQPDERGLIAA